MYIKRTKSITSFFLMIALLGSCAAIFGGCRSDKGAAGENEGKTGKIGAREIVEEICPDDKKSLSRIYCRQAKTGSKEYLADELILCLYSPFTEAHKVFSDMAQDYCLLLSEKDDGYEIHAIRLSSVSDAKYVQEIFEGRIETIQSRDVYLYSPDAYEANIAPAIIYRKGEWVFLLATNDNEKAIKTIRKMAK